MCSHVFPETAVAVNDSAVKLAQLSCVVCHHPITRWIRNGRWSENGVQEPDPNPLVVIDDRRDRLAGTELKRSPLATSDEESAEREPQQESVCRVCKNKHFAHQPDMNLADPECKPIRTRILSRNVKLGVTLLAILHQAPQSRRRVKRQKQLA